MPRVKRVGAGARRPRAKRARPTATRRLHLDTFSGISGNMFLAALLDAGLSRKALVDDLAGLGIDHRLRVSRVQRGALSARYLKVIPGPGERPKRTHRAGHSHHHHGRRYRDIRTLLDRADLEKPVRDRAQAIFAALARAEARVHGIAEEEVHFHEVGAVDAIVDITGAAIGLHRLGITAVSATPVALGHGSVDTAHGRLPLPAPATLELLAGLPTVPTPVAWETVTPTGAAILRVVADEFGALPAMTVETIGYGAGDDRDGPMPNVLRAVIGGPAPWTRDRIVTLETNLDDCVPEHFDHLMDRLLEAGALDVSLQHLQTKKNRPGFLIRVLARPSDREALATLLFAETTTLGVRVTETDRLVLDRSIERVDTPWGRIRVKCARGPGGRMAYSPEYDDCKRAARRSGTPLREIVRVAEAAARDARLAEPD